MSGSDPEVICAPVLQAVLTTVTLDKTSQKTLSGLMTMSATKSADHTESGYVVDSKLIT